jgi:hypothetical protein
LHSIARNSDLTPPSHKHKAQNERFNFWGIRKLLWPGNSPDLNAIDNREECFYDIIDRKTLPGFQQLKGYNNFMILRLAKREDKSFNLIIGEVDGRKERIGILEIDITDGSWRRDGGFFFRATHNISFSTKLGVYSEIMWLKRKIRLG